MHIFWVNQGTGDLQCQTEGEPVPTQSDKRVDTYPSHQFVVWYAREKEAQAKVGAATHGQRFAIGDKTKVMIGPGLTLAWETRAQVRAAARPPPPPDPDDSWRPKLLRQGSPRDPSKAASSSKLFVVFVTDCTAYQDWQSEVLFRSGVLVKHRGPIVRIASGCEPEAQRRLERRYDALYGTAAAEAAGTLCWAHFTPEYARLLEQANNDHDYPPYNRPSAILHFVTHFPGPADAVVAVVDPDFIFLRPFHTDFTDRSAVLWSEDWAEAEIPPGVGRGTPAAQSWSVIEYVALGNGEPKTPYLYGSNPPLAPPRETLTREARDLLQPFAPFVNTTFGEALKYYDIGPPYIMHVDDWRLMAPDMIAYLPLIRKRYPYLYAEMCAPRYHFHIHCFFFLSFFAVLCPERVHLKKKFRPLFAYNCLNKDDLKKTPHLELSLIRVFFPPMFSWCSGRSGAGGGGGAGGQIRAQGTRSAWRRRSTGSGTRGWTTSWCASRTSRAKAGRSSTRSPRRRCAARALRARGSGPASPCPPSSTTATRSLWPASPSSSAGSTRT